RLARDLGAQFLCPVPGQWRVNLFGVATVRPRDPRRVLHDRQERIGDRAHGGDEAHDRGEPLLLGVRAWTAGFGGRAGFLRGVAGYVHRSRDSWAHWTSR